MPAEKLKVYHATSTGFLSLAFSFSSQRAQMDSTGSIPEQQRQTLVSLAILILEQVPCFGQDSGFISNLSLPSSQSANIGTAQHPHILTPPYTPCEREVAIPLMYLFTGYLRPLFTSFMRPANNRMGSRTILVEHLSPLPQASAYGGLHLSFLYPTPLSRNQYRSGQHQGSNALWSNFAEASVVTMA